MSQLHDMVPGLDDIDRQIADNEQLKDRVFTAQREHDSRLATWQTACRAALLADKTPPPEPEKPEILRATDRTSLDREGVRLRERRRRIIADHADDVVAGLREREQAVIDRVRDRVGDLDPDLAELRAIAGDLLDAVYAHNTCRGRGWQRWDTPNPARVTEAAMLDAVLDANARVIT